MRGPGSHPLTRHWRLARTALVAALAVLGSAVIVAGAHAAYTSSVAGSTATMTGNASDEVLSIQNFGTLFRHNRDTLDAGYSGPTDFNSTGVTTTLPLTGTLNVNAGAGQDAVALGFYDAVSSPSTHSMNGGDGSDYLSLTDYGVGVPPLSVSVTPAQVSGYRVGTLNYSAFETLYLSGSLGADRFTVSGTALGTSVSIGSGNEGDDTLAVADGVALKPGGGFDGSSGNDTLDLSSWSRPVVVSLGHTRSYSASLEESNVVPAAPASVAGGSSYVQVEPATGAAYYNVNGYSMLPADIVSARLGVGPPGVNGAFIESFPGSQFTPSGTSSTVYAYNRELTEAQLSELRQGRIYAEIVTDGSPSSVRGQLTPDTFTGTGPGFPLYNVESASGGSGDDSLVGAEDANVLRGGAGADNLSGAEGADSLDGGPGPDLLSGGAGSDSINAADGQSDQVVCGPDFDSVSADQGDNVAADCENVARVGAPAGTTPVPPGNPPLTNASFARALALDFLGRPLSARRTLAVGRDRSTGLVVVSCRSTSACTADHRVYLGKAPARPFAVARKAAKKTVRLASGRTRVPAGETRAIVVRLTGQGLKALRKAGASRAQLAVRVRDGAGHEKTLRKTLKLRAGTKR